MKKFLIAAVASLVILGGQAETSAAPADNLNVSGVETQDMSAWPKIRDSILGRDNHSRHDYRDDHRRDYRHDHHRDYRDDHRHGHGHNPPPPPPHRR